jgi:hypothetical protein
VRKMGQARRGGPWERKKWKKKWENKKERKGKGEN